MSKVTMPEPVAVAFLAECGNVAYTGHLEGPYRQLRALSADGRRGASLALITTTQAEAYKDACVKEALEAAAAVAEERSAVLPHYSDFIRGYADGRKAAASEIRALMPPLRGVEQQ